MTPHKNVAYVIQRLGQIILALTLFDQEMNGNDNKRTTEKDIEDLHQAAVNRIRYTTPTNR